MATWGERAERLAVKRRELRRQGKLSPEADEAAGFLGALLYRIDQNPALEDELQGLMKAFTDAISGDGK